MIPQIEKFFREKHQLIQLSCILFIGLVIHHHAPLPASEPLPDAARPGFEAIRAENMQAVLTFLASDELEGRSAGERGLKIAAKFLESQYRLAGLTPAPGQNSMLQKMHFIKSKVDAATTITILSNQNEKRKERPFHLYEDFVLTAKISENDIKQAPVIFAGFGYQNDSTDYNDYDKLQVQGKIVLILSGIPDIALKKDSADNTLHAGRFRARRAKIKLAEDAGAEALLVVNNRYIPKDENQIARWQRRSSYKLPGDEDGFPTFYVSEPLADALLAFTGWTVDSLRTQMLNQKTSVTFPIVGAQIRLNVKIQTELKETQNVVAYLKGSDPALQHEVVAFSAHYDHLGMDAQGNIYNGADDDGSGTTGLLEVARAFAKNSPRPKRSLIFISHTGEEKGLLGSRHYTDHPLIPLDSMVALLNMDMIGRNQENSVYIIGSDFLSKELHQINEAANRHVGLELDYTYNTRNHPERFYYRSDHYNYAKHGIPIIFYFSGTHEDYHKSTDTVEKIDFIKMQHIARLVYLTGWDVANRQHRIRVERDVVD
ncbi:MAG: M20/M25/M40 family metallo-hydrolase [bacterium]